MTSELDGRQYGFLLPDRSRIAGPDGGRHGQVALAEFPDREREREREHGLEAFLHALDLGWVSYSVGSRHVTLYLLDEPGPRELAAELVAQEGRDDVAANLFERGTSRTGACVNAHFPCGDRAAVRWLRSSTLPAWYTSARIVRRDGWTEPWRDS